MAALLAMTATYVAGKDAESASAGRVTGVVRYEGLVPRSWRADEAAPVAEPLPPGVEPDPQKMKPARAVEVTDEGGVRHTAVTLENAEAKRALQDLEFPTAVVDQVGSIFIPRVTVLPAGASVLFKNSDGINHNVHVLAGSQEKNWLLKAGERRETRFRLSRAASIVCDLHAWMRASLFIVPTPYFAITDSEGRFSIEGVPPGEYTVRLWHDRLHPAAEDPRIEIAPGATIDLELTLQRAKRR